MDGWCWTACPRGKLSATRLSSLCHRAEDIAPVLTALNRPAAWWISGARQGGDFGDHRHALRHRRGVPGADRRQEYEQLAEVRPSDARLGRAAGAHAVRNGDSRGCTEIRRPRKWELPCSDLDVVFLYGKRAHPHASSAEEKPRRTSIFRDSASGSSRNH